MILDEILATTRVGLVERKAALPEAALWEEALATPPPREFGAVLRSPGVSIVAEIKRASPSRGVMNAALRPEEMAVLYASAGAAAISVLTEETRFCGSLSDLRETRDGLEHAGLARPVLRKDFIVDRYQILEARAWGADAVLLIVAALDGDDLADLFAFALELGLTPLVEVHDSVELDRALALHPPIIGMNNRNLRDFSVDLDVTRRLRSRLPAECVTVSESGIRDPEDMRVLASLGVDAGLIGEALVTAPDPAARLKELLEAGR